MTANIPEIVSPAGTPDKLRTAFHFGADACYLGLKQFSLRAFAGNFELDQLEWAVGYARERGKKIYVTLNILPFDTDLDAMTRILKKLHQIGPDALVVGDPAAIELARENAPSIPIHLSTQFSVSNHLGAKFWFRQGIKRIVVARELSVEQLSNIASHASGPIEAFVHGAVCVAWSGRCMLSAYWATPDRDARRGSCAQGCRWRYTELEDSRRPGQRNLVQEDERGTYFFDAKDLCAMPVLGRLLQSQVSAWKIEGRTRSELYVGVTADVYRHAREHLPKDPARVEQYMDELSRLTNRGFSTHFLEGHDPGREAYNPEGSYGAGRNVYAGKVTANKGDALLVDLKYIVDVGDRLEVRDAGLQSETVKLAEIRDEKGTVTDRGRAGTTLLVPGAFSATPGALVRFTAEPDAGSCGP